jgi:hypothetical protein
VELATPRLVPGHERRGESEAPGGGRRERPRIAARATAAEAPVAAVAAGAGLILQGERGMVDSAIAALIARSAALTEELGRPDKVPVDLILEHARLTTEQVVAHLSSAGSPELRRINADLGEILDLVMLMQLEKGHAPADDALTLLLQIRRDLETLRPT